MKRRAGIHGIGIYLPEDIRKNSWWPESTVEKWRQKANFMVDLGATKTRPELQSEGASLVIEAMIQYVEDPFLGARERRVMPADLPSSAMEIAAAQDALARSGVPASKIGLLLTFSQVPDYLLVPTAPRVHSALKLRSNCLSASVDAACNSFLTQLSLAQYSIQSGAIEYALLIQSSAALHLADPEEQYSTWFGDGATAVVLGPVPEDLGLFESAHQTDGSMYDALVVEAPTGHRWYEGHGTSLLFKDVLQAIRLALGIPHLGKCVVDAALSAAGIEHEDVGFYASHQGTHWLRRVTQAHIGLPNARHFDSYELTASLSAANIPFQLAMAERKGMLSRGDLVAMYSGGSGIMVSGAVLRWGKS